MVGQNSMWYTGWWKGDREAKDDVKNDGEKKWNPQESSTWRSGVRSAMQLDDDDDDDDDDDGGGGGCVGIAFYNIYANPFTFRHTLEFLTQYYQMGPPNSSNLLDSLVTFLVLQSPWWPGKIELVALL